MAPARWRRLVPFGASRKETVSSPSTTSVATKPPKTAEPALDPPPQGLKIVAEGVNPVVDIVAVHGLNGHRDKTWTASNGVHWLRDLLPNDIPHARIICWGYDANTHGDRVSCQYLYDHARSLVADLKILFERHDPVSLAHDCMAISINKIKIGTSYPFVAEY